MFAYILGSTSVRVSEDHMSCSYGREWKRAAEKVRLTCKELIVALG